MIDDLKGSTGSHRVGPGPLLAQARAHMRDNGKLRPYMTLPTLKGDCRRQSLANQWLSLQDEEGLTDG